jgi:tRNA pseudouridine38-40 synthase
MGRYFLEVAYKGTRYSGFQVQQNAITIQSEVERALKTLYRQSVELTGSSRTDAGVHAFQNYFHFDFSGAMHSQGVYKLNAILPPDIVVKNIFPMPSEAHSRFDATSREYVYSIHRFKNPFLNDTSHYYPYELDFEAIKAGAFFLNSQKNFFSFSKTNTQVRNFDCLVTKSEWQVDDEQLTYTIEANRFLRGMIRLITATLLKLGRGKIAFQEFESLFKQARKCGYSVPAHGLALHRVNFPENYFL